MIRERKIRKRLPLRATRICARRFQAQGRDEDTALSEGGRCTGRLSKKASDRVFSEPFSNYGFFAVSHRTTGLLHQHPEAMPNK